MFLTSTSFFLLTEHTGSANIENGVTIDMRGLKGIEISKDNTYVTISVGETWGSVYEELEKHGLTTAGGRVGRVGVGGLVLGGESLNISRVGGAHMSRWPVLLFNPRGFRV